VQSIFPVTPAKVLSPAFCLHVLQQKRDAGFRWHDGENWEVISTDRKERV
jgi:hypothetical protein